MYAVRLGKENNRYLNWIDEKWYETTDIETHKFQESDLPQIKQWLANHFRYKATFISNEGKTIEWDYFLDKQKKQTIKKTNGLKIKFKL